jgi:hypothetical protein
MSKIPQTNSRIIIITPVPDASATLPSVTQKTESYSVMLHELADRIAAGENIQVDVLHR